MARELTFNITEDRRRLVEPTNVEGFEITFDRDIISGSKNWVDGRIGEDAARQVFVNVKYGPNNEAYDLTGIIPEFCGLTAKGGPENRNYSIIDNWHSVMVDPQGGRFRFDFPKDAFAVAGSYKQAFFNLKREGSGEVVATLEFDMKVMANFVYSNIIPKDFITPYLEVLDRLISEFKQGNVQKEELISELQKTVQNKLDIIEATFKSTNDTLESLRATANSLSEKIKQDGLFTQGEAELLEIKIKSNSVNRFLTVENLKNADLKPGDAARTLGFYTEGDGGGALYVIRDSRNEMNHFEDLNNGKFAELVHQNSQINVRQMGAYGDGLHEDTSKIQEAIDLIGKHRIQGDDEGSSVEKERSQWSFPSTIFFPNGVYLTGQINIGIGSLSLKGNRTTPWNRGSILLAKNGLTSSVFKYSFPNPSVFTDMIVGGKIEDLAILGSLRRQSLENSADAAGILIENLAECNISNVYIANFKKGGISAKDWWDSTITGLEIRACGTDATFASLDLNGDDDNSNSLHFFGLHIEDTPYMLHLGKTANIQFVGSKFESSGVRKYRANETNNPYIKVDELCSQVTFADCFFTFNYGLGMLNSGNAIVSSSHFYSGTNETTNAGTVLKSEKDGIFSKNIFDGFSKCSSEIPVISLGKNNVFSENRIELIDDEAFVEIGEINSISGNRFNGYNVGNKGIVLTGARNSFDGNYYINFQSDVFKIANANAKYQANLDNRVIYPVETQTLTVINPKGMNTSNPLTWYYTGANEKTLDLSIFADKDDDFQFVGYEFYLTTNRKITIPGNFDSFGEKVINPGQTAKFVKTAEKNKWRISIL